jgi:hypothetical protein
VQLEGGFGGKQLKIQTNLNTEKQIGKNSFYSMTFLNTVNECLHACGV